jgi:hypothetical protein
MMQGINTTVYNNIVGLYVQHSDEVYYCLLIKCYNYVRLVMLLYKQYKILVYHVCYALFDSGADKTMMKVWLCLWE